jgi:hypothetical protein
MALLRNQLDEEPNGFSVLVQHFHPSPLDWLGLGWHCQVSMIF